MRIPSLVVPTAVSAKFLLAVLLAVAAAAAQSPDLLLQSGDFGTFCVGESVERDVTLTNPGPTPVTLESDFFQRPFSLSQPFPSGQVLPPNSSLVLRVRADGFKSGFFVKLAAVRYRDLAGKRLVAKAQMTASVTEVNLDTGEIDFGEVEVGSESSQTILVTRCGSRPAQLLTSASGAPFSAGPSRRPTRPDEQVVVTAFFRPSEVGDFTGVVTVQTQKGAPRTVVVKGKGIRKVSLLPQHFEFGKVSRNVIHARSATLANHTAEPLSITVDGKLHAEYFTLSPRGLVVLPPLGSVALELRFGAKGKCRHRGTVEIRDTQGVLRVAAPVSVQTK